jgi:hypothetical protein
MKAVLFTVFVTIFGLTALVTLAGLVGWVTIADGYLKALVGAFLLQLATSVIAAFRSAKLFAPPKHTTLVEYTPDGDALRLLATLCRYQKQCFPNSGSDRWGFSITPQSSDFPAFLNGLAELVSYKLVEVQADKWMCGLSTLGIQMCPKWEKRFKKAATFIVT